MDVVGSRHKACIDCGEVLESEAIEALEKEVVDETTHDTIRPEESVTHMTAEDDTRVDPDVQETENPTDTDGGCSSLVVSSFTVVMLASVLGWGALFKKKRIDQDTSSVNRK